MAGTQGNQGAAIGGKLKSLEITLSDYAQKVVLDLRPFVSDLTIYENMFVSSIMGVATIIDSVGFMSGYGFPILGEEFVTIKYEAQTGAGSSPKTLNLFLFKISPVFNGENFKHKRYILHFCSREHLEDASDSVQKAYSKPNSEIVKDILSNYLKTKKKIEVLDTKGIQQVIIPNLGPFDAIEFIRRRSIAQSKHTSASYVFFETTEGYKFGDIEWLIEEGRKKISANKDRYTYRLVQSDLQNFSIDDGDDDAGDPRNYNKAQFKALFSFVQTHKVDTIEKIKMGMFQSFVETFDPVYLTLTETKFHYDPNKTISMGKFPENSPSFITDFSLNRNGQQRQIGVFKDSGMPDTYLDQILPQSASYMTRLAQNMFTAKVIGDPAMLVGDLITVPNMPAFRTPDGKGNDDKLLAGEFLIVGIVHKFGQESYVQDWELYRNGYSTSPEKVIDLSS
jgi:hypothetical protein